MDKWNILFTIGLLALIMCSIGVGYTGHSKIENAINNYKYNSANTPESCKGLDLVTTAYCLNNRVKEIYKFNITDDWIDLTFEELKQNGGDCRDWAKLYCNWAKELGYDVDRPIVMDSNETGHTFCVISNDDGYCIMEQMYFKCFKIEQ